VPTGAFPVRDLPLAGSLLERSTVSEIIVALDLFPRSCPLCGETQVRDVWSYQHTEPTRQHRFLWSVRNVICERCGFSFVAPSPSAEQLADYYADAFPLMGEGYFSVEARMECLRRHSLGRKSFVEIGSNTTGVFYSQLQAFFKEVTSVEINDACSCDAKSTAEIPDNSADVVAAYFVLEHVPQPGHFLSECRRIVRNDRGIVIIEVPDLHLYPQMIAALDTQEHLNHFSPLTLEWLAARSGLELIETSHRQCSRTFGFVAVFRPAEPISYRPEWNERSAALASFSAGLELVRSKRQEVSEHRANLQEILGSGRKVVIWAANAMCRRLLDGFVNFEGLTIVDIDRAKLRFLDQIEVRHPDDAKREIVEADVIWICSPVHARNIGEYIESELHVDTRNKTVRLIRM